MKKQQIVLHTIRTNGGTQPRKEIDEEIVSEYAEALEAGRVFPPVVIFWDGVEHWLADGFHRTHAARRIGLDKITAEVHEGTKRDAVLYSVGANANHGLRRSIADKRKAVETLLNDEEWGKWSDNQIAKSCGVSPTFVGNTRRSLSIVESEEPRTYTTKHGTTATMNTGKIGKAPAKDEGEPSNLAGQDDYPEPNPPQERPLLSPEPSTAGEIDEEQGKGQSSEVEALRDELDETKALNKILQADFDHMAKFFDDEGQADLDLVKKEADRLKTMNSSLQGRINALMNEVKFYKGKAAGHEKRAAKLEKENAKLQDQINAADAF